MYFKYGRWRFHQKWLLFHLFIDFRKKRQLVSFDNVLIERLQWGLVALGSMRYTIQYCVFWHTFACATAIVRKVHQIQNQLEMFVNFNANFQCCGHILCQKMRRHLVCKNIMIVLHMQKSKSTQQFSHYFQYVRWSFHQHRLFAFFLLLEIFRKTVSRVIWYWIKDD
jgi:hypothetical protein